MPSPSEPVSEAAKEGGAPPKPSSQREDDQDQAMNDVDDRARLSEICRDHAMALAKKTHDIVLRRPEIARALPYVHVTLVFMLHLIRSQEAISVVAPEFPWKLLATRLNSLMDVAPRVAQSSLNRSLLSVVEGEAFPHLPEKADVLPVPLPEDYALRGIGWAEDYFPDGWFSNNNLEDDERLLEPPSLEGTRTERAIWVGCRIAAHGKGKWLTYDKEAHRFGVAPEWDVDVADGAPVVPTAGTMAASTTVTKTIVLAGRKSAYPDHLPDAAAEA